MRNVKPTDEVILADLRRTVWAEMDDQTFDLVVKAVEEAGDIRDTTGYAMTLIQKAVVEKGRFSSRSEAGRYAANMRWRGSVPADSGQGGRAQAEAIADANAREGKGSTRATIPNVKGGRVSEPKTSEDSKQRAFYAEKIKTGKLSAIANVIYDDITRSQGKKVPVALEPYLDAMSSLDSVNDNYGMDSGRSIVAYALSNMGTYKGETARAAKAKLKELLKG